ncbi:MAG: ATP-binding protein [bacterium]
MPRESIYKFGIQTKLSIALGILVFISLITFGLLSNIIIKEALDKQMGKMLVYQAEMIAERLRSGILADWLPETVMLEKFLQNELMASKTIRSNLDNIILIGTGNRVLADANKEFSFGEELNILKLDQVELEHVWNGFSEASVLYKGKDGRQYKPAYAPVTTKSGKVVAVVRVEASADFLDITDKVSMVLMLIALIITALAALLGVLIAKPIVNPIKKLAAASQSIADGDLDTEVIIKSKDEIGFFAQTFNQMAKNLKKLYEEVAEHSKQIVELSASVAHEVRSPISAIQGFTELLEYEIKSENVNYEKVMEYINDIKEEVHVLNSKVSDFIYFAKPLVIEPYPLDITDILETALSSMDKEINDGNIIVRTNIQSDLPAVMGDFDQLRGMFINLIRNAVQSMEGGGEINIALRSANGSIQNANQRYIEVTIEDKGCGMSPEDLEMAFEPFFTTKSDGTGLGLSIVKKIINAHNGDIELESTKGLGTIVRIFLPAEGI